MVGARQISGTGGSVDFMRSASASEVESIVACTAPPRMERFLKSYLKLISLQPLGQTSTRLLQSMGSQKLRTAHQKSELIS